MNREFTSSVIALPEFIEKLPDALQQIDEAGRQIMSYAELYLHPQYLISRARILLAASPDKQDTALALLDRAQRVAIRQTAHLFTLRAALEKCRIAPQCAAMRDALRQLVNALPDHPSIPDLQSARVLLNLVR